MKTLLPFALMLLYAGCTAVAPPPPDAPEREFPEAFETATDWHDITVEPPAGHPAAESYRDISDLVVAVRDYLAAHPFVSEEDVTVDIPSGIEEAGSGQLLVQMIGGIREVGSQWRITLTRSDGAWVLDPTAEFRMFCPGSLGGRRLNRCADE